MSGRTRLVAMATAVTLACLPTAARADMTGNDLWRVCASKDARDNGLCYGYMTAIAEVIRQPAGLFGHHACLSDDTAIQQIVDVVKRYLDQHPEVRHYGSFGLLAPALSTKEPSGRGMDRCSHGRPATAQGICAFARPPTYGETECPARPLGPRWVSQLPRRPRN